MKKIKDKRKFGVAVISTILAIACVIGWFIADREMRFLAAAVAAFVYAMFNYYGAFTIKGILEELEADIDERDKYLTLKASNTSVKIINGLLTAGCLVCLILQAALQSQILMAVAITLVAVIVMMFVIMLLTSSYYEKKN